VQARTRGSADPAWKRALGEARVCFGVLAPWAVFVFYRNRWGGTLRPFRPSIATVLDVSDRRLERKLREADRRGARALVILGPEEMASASATVRDLHDRQQRRVPADGVVAAITDLLGSGPGDGGRAIIRQPG
ncbi:MAG: His/Gly/Thr/Pro-type tRNA ligase C-terminal domain-containing protein, partial [Candidatus Dormibacteria bacterium]